MAFTEFPTKAFQIIKRFKRYKQLSTKTSPLAVPQVNCFGNLSSNRLVTWNFITEVRFYECMGILLVNCNFDNIKLKLLKRPFTRELGFLLSMSF